MATDKPVPAKRAPKARGKPSVRWKQRFLEAYANTLNVRAACMKAQVSRTTVYAERKKNPTFDAQFLEAKEDAIEALEAEAWKRATAERDTTLLIFLLKALRPEVYRERFPWNNGQTVSSVELRVVYENGDPYQQAIEADFQIEGDA